MTQQHQVQSATLPPAQPTYVLRGHNAQIHSVCFLRDNTRLLTGDADGWVVLWNVTSRRPAAVWRPHQSAILGLDSWDDNKIITHGRDSKLLVWQLSDSDESSLSTVLPIDAAGGISHTDPWLVHSVTVSTINFCSFAKCSVPAGRAIEGIVVAVSGQREETVDIYNLPSQNKIAAVDTLKGVKTGMVMAIRLCFQEDRLLLAVGYESGYTALWYNSKGESQWKLAYTSKAHTQPILSLDLATSQKVYLTSGADAIVASNPLVATETKLNAPLKQTQTKHSGQQSLAVRKDEKIFATAGWDGRIRVYSVKTMRELAVLKWHKEGCYAVAFADPNPAMLEETTKQDSGEGDLVHTSHQSVQQRRHIVAQSTHWLAAGSKDGKVSLWDIY